MAESSQCKHTTQCYKAQQQRSKVVLFNYCY